MNILIAGLGALGTVHACLLKKAGHTVHALTREQYLGTLRDRTVCVSGILGSHEAVLDGIHASIDPVRNILFDLIILTVKAYDTEPAIRQVGPLVGRDTLALCAQNGYGNYETVADAVGREHTLLARVIFGVKLFSPGRAEVMVFGDPTRIGNPDNAVPRERIGMSGRFGRTLCRWLPGADLSHDTFVAQNDINLFLRCLSGPGVLVEPGCLD